MAAPSLADQPVDVVVHHIVKTPGVMGGRARIKGTRISVMNVISSCEVEGWTPQDYQRSFHWLSLADVYAAFAYYHDHRAELEAELVADDALVEEFKRQHPESVITLRS